MGLPYTPNPANIRRFLGHIQGAGVPSKVTQTYLEAVGFRSKNDRYLIGVLKQIGFLDDSGAPTERWRQYRDKTQAPAVLAQAVRTCYSGLFEAYPDAHSRDPDTLRNFMSASTDAAEATVGRMVSTFRALSGMAAFDARPLIQPADARTQAPQLGPIQAASFPKLPEPDDGMEQFASEGILIRIRPTDENVRRAIKFLQIYLNEKETR